MYLYDGMDPGHAKIPAKSGNGCLIFRRKIGAIPGIIPCETISPPGTLFPCPTLLWRPPRIYRARPISLSAGPRSEAKPRTLWRISNESPEQKARTAP